MAGNSSYRLLLWLPDGIYVNDSLVNKTHPIIFIDKEHNNRTIQQFEPRVGAFQSHCITFDLQFIHSTFSFKASKPAFYLCK
ncbi:unnamed protein product [Rotaria magnacalcarata]